MAGTETSGIPLPMSTNGQLTARSDQVGLVGQVTMDAVHRGFSGAGLPSVNCQCAQARDRAAI